MKKHRRSLTPAWKAHGHRNMRGATVCVGGTQWLVITHIRDGWWKAGRVSGSWDHGDYTTLQLDRHGRVVRSLR